MTTPTNPGRLRLIEVVFPLIQHVRAYSAGMRALSSKTPASRRCEMSLSAISSRRSPCTRATETLVLAAGKK
jgi:hypothetical protein